MTYIAAGLLATVVLLLLALYRQQVNHLNHLTGVWVKAAGEREQDRAERRMLADRIQHPAVRQVDAAPVVLPEVPRDAAEFAQVGMIVPDGVHVGTLPDVMDWIGMEVPDHITVAGMNGG